MIGTRPPSWPYYLNPETTQAYGVVAAYLGANGGNTLYDLGPRKQYHGTLTNSPTWTTGKFGEPAISYNGSTSYTRLADNTLSKLNDFSISTWATVGASGSYRAAITSDETRIFLGVDTSNNFYAQIITAAIATQAVTGGTLSAGQWYHLAWTRSSVSGSAIYINGALSNTNASSTDAEAKTVWTMGADYNAGGSLAYPWNGNVGQPVFHGKVLTANQVTELYRNPFLLYWQPSPVRTFWMGAAPAAGGTFQSAWAINSTVTINAMVPG